MLTRLSSILAGASGGGGMQLAFAGVVVAFADVTGIGHDAGKFMESIQDASKGRGKGDSIVFGSDTKSVTKLNNQMVKRGWSETTVRDTVSKPYTTRVSTNKATGNPATVYYNQSGGYVIIDDVTDVIVQVSDNINPSTWAPDPSIIDPYIPK